MARRSHTTKKAAKAAEEKELATAEEIRTDAKTDIETGREMDARTGASHAERTGINLSSGFINGAIVVLSILVVISAYILGYQYGALSVGAGTTTGVPAAAAQQAQAAAPAQAAQPTVAPPPDVPKSAKPEVDLFIMSYCPFGLQMQKAYLQAAELLEGKAEMEVKWVNYIMHDFKEVEDNTRQYCIQQEQPTKYLAYAKCFVQSNDHAACAAQAGIDTAKLDTCYQRTFSQYGIQESWDDTASWLSGRYAQYKVHDAENQEYGVRGSPTLVINGQTVSVARSAEAVKQAICNAFITPPAECAKTLNSNQEQPGAGPIGVGTTAGAAAAAGCAT